MQLGDLRLHVGYLGAERTESVGQCRFDLDFDDASIERHVRGQVELLGQDGGRLAGRIEPLTGAEMDISHCFDPPRASIYRRTLIRFTPDDDLAPCLGWLESNRFPEQ